MTTIQRPPIDGTSEAPPDTQPTRRRRIGFRVLVVVATVAGLPLWILGMSEVVFMWLSDKRLVDTFDDLGVGGLAFRSQFFHLGIVAWALYPSLLVQLRRPDRREAAALQGAVVAAVAALAMAASGALELVDVGLVAVFGAVAVLHPRSTTLFRRPDLDKLQLATVAIGALGWIPLAVTFGDRAWDQRGLPATMEHEAHLLWANSVVMALVIVAVGTIGALDRRGWQLSAFTATGSAVAVGAHALVHPDQAASVGTAGAVLAIGWGLVYGVATVQRTRRGTVA